MTTLQQTEAWFAARRGHVTASRVADVVARTRSGPAAARANYAAEIIVERLTGISVDAFVSPAMQWGADTEPLARAAYAFHADADVTETGFVLHPRLPMSGASPDGLVGDFGLVEIKCPNTATHIDTLLGAPIADRHIIQMQWQLACTGRAWCDFVSFDPRLPHPLRLFTVRIAPDPKRIQELELQVEAFLEEIDVKIEQLIGTFKPQHPRRECPAG